MVDIYIGVVVVVVVVVEERRKEKRSRSKIVEQSTREFDF